MSLRKILMLAKKRWLFTNKIRNPRGEGGTVGVIGSGGALPTNWAVEQAMSGVVTSFLGAGTAGDGRSYVDIGLAGTLSGANPLIIRMEAATYAAALPGQAYGLDFGSMLQAGTATGLASVKARIRDSAGIAVAESSENGLSGTATRLQAKGVVSGSATSIYPRIVVDSLNNGATVAATIRIYAPKLVQVAVVEGPELVTNGDFASNVIGWTNTATTLTFNGGKARQAGISANGASYQAVSSSVNTIYKISADYNLVTNVGSTYPRVGTGTNAGNGIVAQNNSYTGGAVGVGTLLGYFSAASSSTNIYFGAGGANSDTDVIDWDNISVKQITPGYLPAFPILPPVGVPGDSSAWLS